MATSDILQNFLNDMLDDELSIRHNIPRIDNPEMLTALMTGLGNAIANSESILPVPSNSVNPTFTATATAPRNYEQEEKMRRIDLQNQEFYNMFQSLKINKLLGKNEVPGMIQFNSDGYNHYLNEMLLTYSKKEHSNNQDM